MLKLLFITGWNSPNPRGTGRVAERAETSLNRPVPNPREKEREKIKRIERKRKYN
jgi:hypothetical protein